MAADVIAEVKPGADPVRAAADTTLTFSVDWG